MSKTHRGKRGGRKGDTPIFDKALAENVTEKTQYEQWIIALALMRYEWTLPGTCNARYLEERLLFSGHATIAKDPESPVWYSIGSAGMGDLNPYGEPLTWQCMGADGKTLFNADWSSGVYIWDRESHVCLWPKLSALADKLSRYARTEGINLLHQFTPYLITAPEEQVQGVQNVFAQMVAGQPAIIGYESLSTLAESGVQALSTNVEWIGDKLQAGALGCWGEVFRILGIPHLQYEKKERLITDEADTTLAPTRLMLDDGLRAREKAADYLYDTFGLDVDVRVNPMIEKLFEGEPMDVGSEVDTDGQAL